MTAGKTPEGDKGNAPLIDEVLAGIRREGRVGLMTHIVFGYPTVEESRRIAETMVEAGVDPQHPAIARAVRFLCDHQNADGGWGEDMRSYDDRTYRAKGESTASQTAWSLLALLAAGERGGTVARGVDWLVRTQREDGGWDEEAFTGTGFPSFFYIRYHLYRVNFPIMALGRYLRTHS